MKLLFKFSIALFFCFFILNGGSINAQQVYENKISEGNKKYESGKKEYTIGEFSKAENNFIQAISALKFVNELKLKDYKSELSDSLYKALRIKLEKDKKSADLKLISSYKMLALIMLAVDDTAQAKKYSETLLLHDPSFKPTDDDPLVFRNLIDQLKVKPTTPQVVSVSKNAENLYQAPASVILISEEDIINRGYIDLEALLHDLPGFDISRSVGLTYSHIYQRGYRSDNTNRMLFVIDGVEQNDLWGNIVYLSRQYPISNVKSVEVVYGPSSTIYGANAFLGVVSIITKNAEDYIMKNDRFGLNAQAGFGSYDSRYFDFSGAITPKNSNISMTFSARYFESNEQDLSGYEEYDYAGFTNNEDFITSMTVDASQDSLLAYEIQNTGNTNYYTVNGNIITPTNFAADKAKGLDNELLKNNGYSNKSQSIYLSAKIKLYEFTVGFEYWRKDEGVGAWVTDGIAGNSNSGQTWAPFNSAIYVKYNKELSKKLRFVNFIRFKNNGLTDPTALSFFSGYSNGRHSLLDLMNDSLPKYNITYYELKSNQIRNETQLIYSPNRRFDLVTGIEYRSSIIQGNYVTSSMRYADEEGSAPDVPGGNHYFSKDFGVYSQANYGLIDSLLNVTIGARLDYNKIRSNGGYGLAFNPRLAVVYYPENWTFKVIYSEAFKDPTNFERYSVAGVRTESNPNLVPEKVRNVEASVRRFIGKNFNVEVLGYKSFYSNAVTVVDSANLGTKVTFESIGKREVFGVQTDLNYVNGNIRVYLNYTFTSPFEDSLRIADIADHQVNIGANYRFLKDFNINLRSNFVGAKKVGENTTAPGNLLTFDPYFILNSALSYDLSNRRKFEFKENGDLKKDDRSYNLKLQLMINNILDTEYFSPGIRSANGAYFSSRLPQFGRNFQLRVILTL